MGFMGRLLAVVVAVFALTSADALAAGTLRVDISGPGSVTGSGISCSRALGGATVGTCSDTYANIRVCEPGPLKPICLLEPQDVAFTASTAASGFVFDGWTGACAGQRETCSLTMDDDYSAGASFRDNQDPAVALGGVGAGAIVRGAAVGLTATAGDNAAVKRVEFSLGGVTISDASAPYSASFDTTGLKDGAAVAQATAVDTSDRTKSAAVSVTIDNTGPALGVGGTPDGAVLAPGSVPSWTLAASDKTTGIAQVRCSVVAAGGAPAFGACSAGTTGHSVTGKPGGAYVFTARAVDGAGNVTDVSRGFTIDATPPTTTLTGGIADGGTTTETSLAWQFSASEAASFACRVYPAALTPGDFAPCSADGSHTANGFAPGTYTFEVRATDGVGNVEAAPVKRTFTVVPPPGPPSVGVSNVLAASSAAKPQIVVTLAFGFANSTKKQTKLTSLVVKNVPAGSTVSAACPKSCAKKTFKKTGASGNVSLAALIKKPLKVGTTITVTVSKPGYTSVVKTLKVQPRKSPTLTTRSI